MRKATAALGLLALATVATAELGFTRVAALSAGANNVTINASTLTVVNEGSNEVYVRVFWEGETPADATTSSPEIKSGESFTFSRSFNITAISLVCASGETATVRLYYW